MRAEVSALGGRAPLSSVRKPPRPERHEGAWLRPFRRWDGYREAVAAALRQLHARGTEEPAEDREKELAGR